MGANKVNTNFVRYFKPMRGFMVTKINLDDPDEDRMTFKFQTGQSQEYAVFASIDGYITGIEIKDTEYGKYLQISMSDGPESLCVTMKHDSNEAIDFYNHMKKINFQEDVQFVHWRPKDKDYYRLLVMQKDDDDKWKQVGYSFEKDEAPSWREVEINGEKRWDKGPALKFYAQHLKEVITQLALYGNTAKRPVVEQVVEDDQDNDLPF